MTDKELLFEEIADLGKPYILTDYNIIDNKEVHTAKIQSLIDTVSDNGGGVIVVPKGTYLTGALFFKQGVNLYLCEGGTLKGSDSAEDFPICRYRWEGHDASCYASLINAGIGENGVRGFVIAGAGTIDANGVTIFNKEMKEQKGARGRAVCIQNSSDITIEGVTIRQSPSWCLHLINSRNIRINNVKIHTKYDEHGKRYKNIFNGDGIDADSCQNVSITNSLIASQDDCIAVKSGKDAEGRASAAASENIHIENCRFESGFGVAVGSEMSGGVRNVTVRDCTFNNTFSIGSIKTCRGRGGVIEDILFENVSLLNTDTEHKDCKWFRGGIYVDSYYSNDEISTEKHPVTEETPLIKNITFRNVKLDTCGGNAIYISGLPEMHCKNISLENITAIGKYGMKVYFTDNLKMENVTVSAREGEDYLIDIDK